jgi:UDP-N-acetylglucosamine 4,6-dehydratase/5-epimerase
MFRNEIKTRFIRPIMSGYKIQEVSKQLELPTSTIRFWGTKFSDFINPTRTNGGQRRYFQKDIDNLAKIKDLLYTKKRTITESKLILKNIVVASDDNSLANKSILITGGTGFIGKHLCNHLLTKCNPQVIRIFSRDEKKQHEMKKLFGEDAVRYFIGDIRDAYRLKRAMEGVDIVIHAAALKQIPTCDFNPFEAVKTNIQGVENIIDAAIDVGVRKVAALSTGEAVNPVNLYGTTRLCAEKILTRGSAYSGSRGTCFCCIRLGNIIGSPGNLIAAYEEQKKAGKIHIADPSMTSFWTTCEQSIELILNALSTMQGGEIFVARSFSIKNMHIANAVAPECALKITGMTTQHKLHEIMITEEEGRNTASNTYTYIILPAERPSRQMNFKDAIPVKAEFSYCSATNDKWLTTDEFRQLLYNFNAPETDTFFSSWAHNNVSRI